MLTNYFKIALRSLGKQKLYGFINIAGLAVGLAFCALIFLYVRDELTFDRMHERADRIVRVTAQSYTPDGNLESEYPWQPAPLAAALERELPEIERAVRFFEQAQFVRRGGDAFEETILFADPAVFEVFSFPLLRGDAVSALDEMDSIVLSDATAQKYFGDEDPVGQTLDVRLGDAFRSVTVTGVAAPVPGNSSVRFDVLMPYAVLPAAYEWIQRGQDRWNTSSYFVYVLLKKDARLENAQAKLPAFYAAHHPEQLDRMRAEGRWSGDGPPYGYRLQPLPAIHLDPSVAAGLTAPSDPRYSYILAAIALAILLIACINFTLLAIGRSAGRAREVGVRKVIGARRGQLLVQFWGESVLLSLLALGLGIGLAELFLPTFNTLAAKDLRFDYLQSATTVAALVGLVLVVGLVAGSYPALVLSGFKPVETFRQRMRLKGSNPLTRSLVVVQFALSVFLIVGTLVMLRQLHFMQTKNLGFDEEHVVVIPTNGEPGPELLARFRTELGTRSDVLGVTGMNNAPAHGWSREGWDYNGEEKVAYTYRVESDFLDVMGVDLVAGRNFDPSRSTDSTGAVLVNEAFVRDFGWADPLGQTLDGFYAEPEVVGVVRDLHIVPLHQAVEPMVLTMDPDWGMGNLLVRLAPGDLPTTLAALEATWDKAAPGVPFQYSFLDDDLAAQYESERRWSRIVGYGALFAVLVACLGLFGLASLTVTQRTKEVGIRKALGASATSIAVLLSKDFAVLVLVAVVLAAPAAYLAAKEWLAGFAYRIDLGPDLFVLAGAAALGIALVTVSVHALRAATADPVKSLRYE